MAYLNPLQNEKERNFQVVEKKRMKGIRDGEHKVSSNSRTAS